MDANGSPRVVFVHDWLTGMRGGEKCLEVLCRHFPQAPLFTLLHQAGCVSPLIEDRPVRTTWMQRLPKVERYYRYLLPLMPAAAANWRLPSCDLVVSLSHCVAKSARPAGNAPHVCYCFTPMRYAWHMREAYFSTDKYRNLKARAIDVILARLREWDRRTSAHVTHFIAISRTVQERIKDCYGRDSQVIFPPVDSEYFHPTGEPRGNYYLIVSAFAPYKRLEIAIEACNRLKRNLVIIGKGQDEARLGRLAGPTIQFLGWQPDLVLRAHYRQCRALLFPGEEDFGIVPLEAQACGAPVIGLGRGGLTETVIPLESRREPTGGRMKASGNPVFSREPSATGIVAQSPSPPASGGECWGEGGQHAARRLVLSRAISPLTPNPSPQRGEGRNSQQKPDENQQMLSSAHPTGVWFDDPSAEATIDAIETFERNEQVFSAAAARRQALKFTEKRFAEEMLGYLARLTQPSAAKLRDAA